MTPERFQRLQSVLRRRQPDLTVLMDNVHKPHNFAAIVRSCDAVGVFEAHAVWPKPRLRLGHNAAGGVARWVRIQNHARIDTACDVLKQRGMQIVAAHFSARSVDYRSLDYTRPTALLMGAELDGVSEMGAELADHHAVIPMLGMVASLNVSVATATLLFEAQRQREKAGLYADCRLEASLYVRTLFEWAHPRIASWCQRHGRDYPPLDENGDPVGDFRR
ncbi:MAG: tRNA (guanosine(18)-2'-O)-methyltransferase TrmH [Gammaproteobacteria bacterium]|nr:tRNA (guanosine(18)-2'-O)-methyltransferase TrmH [Gammaproteobacteria bacterium]